MPEFKLTKHHSSWASKRRRQGVGKSKLREMLERQGGRCALSGVEMVFDVKERTPEKGGRGCHPLSPAVDHVDPGNAKGDFQLICYALNDLKGHLPPDCFNALRQADAWKQLMAAWKEQAERDSNDRQAFRRLLRPNAERADRSTW